MEVSNLQIVAQLFSIVVGIFSYYKKSVSLSGFVALIVISSLFIWTNQIGLLFSLFYMFASSSLLTKYKKNQKKEFDRVVGKAGPRDYIQAICNLGVATGVFCAGVVGFLFDSYLGAFSQALFQDKNSKHLVEKSSSQTQLLKGITWMNNDLVNLITTLVGAIIGGLVYGILEVGSNYWD